MEEDDYWVNVKKGNFDMMLIYFWGVLWDFYVWMLVLIVKVDYGYLENIVLENLVIKIEMDRFIKLVLVDFKEENVDRDYKKVFELLYDEVVYILLIY